MAMSRWLTLGMGFVLLCTTVVLAECPKDGPVLLRLTADEFDVAGYDAKRGVLAIKPTRTLKPNALRARAVRLRMSKSSVYLQVEPGALKLGLEDGPKGLELVVEADPLKGMLTGPQKPRCDEVVPKRVALERAGLKIASTALPAEGASVDFVNVRAQLSIERGQVETPKLQPVALELARRCARRLPNQGRRLRGAVSVQIETSLVGEPMRPKLVVDGLVNRQFTYCLVSAFRETQALWNTIEPATRAYVTLYLRQALVQPAGPAPSERQRGQATERPPVP